MLLNQCLAISLTPLSIEASLTSKESRETLKKEEEEPETLKFFSFNKKHETKEPNKSSSTKNRKNKKQEETPTSCLINNVTETDIIDKQSSALLLFQQLVDKNITTNNQDDGEEPENAKALKDALSRIEFAGFVVPSWLLLSGSFTDLHCIKTSWSEGNFKSPAGFRIETIGNIRSVNVDYFGLTNSNYVDGNTEKQHQHQQVENTNSNKLSREQQKISIQIVNDDYTISSTNNDYNNQTKQQFVEKPLEKEILKIINSHNTRTKTKEVDTDISSSSNSIHVSFILDYLTKKLNNKSQLVLEEATLNLNNQSIEFLVDCAISELIKSGRLALEPITTREEEEEFPVVQNTHRQQLPQQQNLKQSSSKFTNQSIFHNKVITLPATRKNNQHKQEEREEEEEERFFNENFNLANKERRISTSTSTSNSNSNSTSNKSKSTTLDSGIGQSWDLVSNSPTTTSSKELIEAEESKDRKLCKSSSRSAMFFRENDDESNNNTIAALNAIGLPTTPTTHSSQRSRSMRLLHDNNQNDHHHQQQQQQVIVAKAETQRSQEQIDNDHHNRNERLARPLERRGFSLGRSLSFKPRKFSNSGSVDRWITTNNNNRTATAARRAQQNHDVHLQEEKIIKENFSLHNNNDHYLQQQQQQEQEVKQHHNSESNQNKQFKKNLSNLFRSKSMRIISSGKQKANVAELILRENEGQSKQSNSSTTKTMTMTMMTDRQHYNNNQQQATFDYLATAQPHKRSFSMRRNSLLTFNSKDDCDLSLIRKNNHENDYPTGGKIVLFLRKLFRIRRLSRTRTKIVSEERIIRQNIIGLPTIDNSDYRGNNLTFNDNNHNFNDNNDEKLFSHQEIVKKFNHTKNKPTAAAATSKNNTFLSSPPSSSSSASSSGSSSLIEILDCSSAVNSSHRPFREERLTDMKSMSAKTATTWKCLVKRSESSLSRCSDVSSSSTTNSTVSQQLRKHLDEAYKRHRNCTNQREKEFIDSINVLRQASRHALQTSPLSHHNRSSSSSKGVSPNHQQTIGKQSTINGTKATLFSDTASSVGSITVTTTTCSCSKHQQASIGTSSPSPTTISCNNCNGIKSKDLNNQNDIEAKERSATSMMKHEVAISTTDLTATQLAASNYNNNKLPSTLLQQQSHDAYGCELDHWLNETAYNSNNNNNNASNNGYQNPNTALQHNNGNSCCICTSYLCSVARLCPLTTNFCSATPSSPYSSPLLPPIPSCINNNNNTKFTNDNNSPMDYHDPNHQQQQLQLQRSQIAAEYCCPLWQSMVYNYYQIPNNFDLTNSNPFNSSIHHHEQQLDATKNRTQDQQQVTNRLENFSALQQQQNHQHNTTIDLKIEIGTDFNNKKNKKGSTKGGSIKKLIPSAQTTNFTRLKIPVTSSSTSSSQPITDDDSLESTDLTDESLNIKLERDSCETTTTTATGTSFDAESEGNLRSGDTSSSRSSSLGNSESSRGSSSSRSSRSSGRATTTSAASSDGETKTTSFLDSLISPQLAHSRQVDDDRHRRIET